MIKSVYQEYRPKFMNWIKGKYRIGNKEELSDIYQRSFTILYLKAREGSLNNLGSTLETYLYGVAKYVILEWQREQKSLFTDYDLECATEQEYAEFNRLFKDAKVEGSLVRRMQLGLSQLGETCQKVLKLFYWNSYSMEAIAREVGYKNESVAKKKKYSCLKKLKSLLENEI
jgi:RNA polymerase sigma factor (sigma-70 family)